MTITNTTRRYHLSLARRAILMALDREDGWEAACREWMLNDELIPLQNAIDLHNNVDNRFCLMSTRDA